MTHFISTIKVVLLFHTSILLIRQSLWTLLQQQQQKSNAMFRPTAEHRLLLKHPQDNDRGLVFLIQI